LLQGGSVYVPTDVVVLRSPSRGLQTFVQSSNGLASGCIEAEAIVAALLELVERDAMACQRALARHTRQGFRRVQLNGPAATPLVRILLGRLEQAEVRPIVYDLTVDTCIPVYAAYIYDAKARNHGIFLGTGAHLDPEIALLRALTEAIQSRLVYLAGTRDDLTSRQLLLLQMQDTPALIQELESQPVAADLPHDVSLATPTFDGDIVVILERLEKVGVRHVVAVNLTFSEYKHALAVVRVVAPGLEGFDLRGSTESARAHRYVQGAIV
jgi:ribosomal protein S12 methylthiotransferase accessory factor